MLASADIVDGAKPNATAGPTWFCATFITDGRLAPAEVSTAIDSDSFWSLCVELRRIEAVGHDPHDTLRRVVEQRHLIDAEDACAVVLTRLARDRRRDARPTRHPAPLIAGLIPPAVGPMPDDPRNALEERGRLIEERATTLARTAIRNRAGWVQRIVPGTVQGSGTVPRELIAVAAYRDKYGISGYEPLGPTPNDSGQARDRDLARAAMNRASRSPHHDIARTPPRIGIGL